MSTLPAPLSGNGSDVPFYESPGTRVACPERRTSAKASPRRRGTQVQGRALELLGHAVEYLVDSRMFLERQIDGRAEQEAVQMLMRKSREVFLECPEVVSVWQRVGQVCRRSFARRDRVG